MPRIDAVLASHAPAFAVRRVGAMVLRYWYLLRGSWPRMAELAYWPTMQMLMWGFLSQFMATTSSWVAQGGAVLVAGVLLWDTLFRGQLGVSISFLEELWSRNLGHLFVSPLRPVEWVAALFVMSLIRTLIGVVPAALLAIFIFDYSVFDLGLPLLAFFANLMIMGWWLALAITSLILLNGLGAEGLAWAVVFLLAPVSAVYYPVAVLPGWLQWLSWALPSAHVFEGMRAVLFQGAFSWGHFAAAAGLNLFYMVCAGGIFLWAFHVARERGALIQTGE
ncbi:MAG TPA: ABC transporter permease [Azospirillaceae bacterium]|nr:ABC transporter permease [Azospirillaceae bacterium]